MSEPTTVPAGYTSGPYTYTDGAFSVATDPQPAAPRSLAEIAGDGIHFQLPPPRHGIAGHISDPQHRALAIASDTGRVPRGGKTGQAPMRVLTALARRGLLVLTAHPGPRRANWAYGRITEAGRRELARLDAAHTDRTTRKTAVDRVLNFTPAAAAA